MDLDGVNELVGSLVLLQHYKILILIIQSNPKKGKIEIKQLFLLHPSLPL